MEVILETTVGNIKIALDEENTPNTSANFLEYVKDGLYDGTIFHRVIDNFMIQCGGYDVNFDGGMTYNPIQNEAAKAKPNKRGTVAMARTSDPHSATAQFFINVADNASLNFKEESPMGWGYCVFGEVVEGMEVVDVIKGVATSSQGMHADVPEEPIIINKVTIAED